MKLQEEEVFTPPSPSLLSLSFFFSWLVFFSEVSQFSRSRSPAATQRAAVDSLQLFLLSTRVFLRGGPAELLAPHTALHFNARLQTRTAAALNQLRRQRGLQGAL